MKMAEVKCFQEVRRAGNFSNIGLRHAFVSDLLNTFDDPSTAPNYTLPYMSSYSPFNAFRKIPENNCQQHDDQSTWKKWRQCTIKAELRQTFADRSEVFISSLRQRYADPQGNCKV